MEGRVPLQLQWTVEAQGQAQVGRQLWELGLLVLVAAQGFPDGVRPGQVALEELMLQLAEQQQPDCCRHFLERTARWQMVLDGRVP